MRHLNYVFIYPASISRRLARAGGLCDTAKSPKVSHQTFRSIAWVERRAGWCRGRSHFIGVSVRPDATGQEDAAIGANDAPFCKVPSLIAMPEAMRSASAVWAAFLDQLKCRSGHSLQQDNNRNEPRCHHCRHGKFSSITFPTPLSEGWIVTCRATAPSNRPLPSRVAINGYQTKQKGHPKTAF